MADGVLLQLSFQGCNCPFQAISIGPTWLLRFAERAEVPDRADFGAEVDLIVGLFRCLDLPRRKTGCFGNLFEIRSIDLMIVTDTFFGKRPLIRLYLIECIFKTEILWSFCRCHVTSYDWVVFLGGGGCSQTAKNLPDKRTRIDHRFIEFVGGIRVQGCECAAKGK